MSDRVKENTIAQPEPSKVSKESALTAENMRAHGGKHASVEGDFE